MEIKYSNEQFNLYIIDFKTKLFKTILNHMHFIMVFVDDENYFVF